MIESTLAVPRFAGMCWNPSDETVEYLNRLADDHAGLARDLSQWPLVIAMTLGGAILSMTIPLIHHPERWPEITVGVVIGVAIPFAVNAAIAPR